MLVSCVTNVLDKFNFLNALLIIIQVRIFQNIMLKNTCSDVGLGFPPNIFTTNLSESSNAVIKKRLNYKENEWPGFNEAMKQLVLSQKVETIRVLSGRGQYQLDKEYTYLTVSPQQWIR